MYSVYVNNFDRARERLSKLERENPAVAAFLTACERQRHCRGLRLRDFLIQPVQVGGKKVLQALVIRRSPYGVSIESCPSFTTVFVDASLVAQVLLLVALPTLLFSRTIPYTKQLSCACGARDALTVIYDSRFGTPECG